MKKGTFIAALFIAFVLVSCKKELNTYTIGIDVQSSFDQDSVQVLVDGQDVINRRLQTNYVLGLCPVDGQAVAIRNQGNHEIKVIVNNSITKREIISLDNNLYIGVNYDRHTGEISFIYSDQRFLYD